MGGIGLRLEMIELATHTQLFLEHRYTRWLYLNNTSTSSISYHFVHRVSCLMWSVSVNGYVLLTHRMTDTGAHMVGSGLNSRSLAMFQYLRYNESCLELVLFVVLSERNAREEQASTNTFTLPMITVQLFRIAALWPVLKITRAAVRSSVTATIHHAFRCACSGH